VDHRYAILWEHVGDASRPAGLVLDRGDHVVVEAPDDLMFPSRFDEPFVVGGITSPIPVTYQPRHPQYFDQVLIELSRTFSIGERATVASASDGVLLRLLRDKVWAPLRESHTEHYAVQRARGGCYPVVRRHNDQHYRGATPQPAREPASRALARENSLVAA
jgi:hypothetical protein